MTMMLHSYWRSGAAWRVRIALALKGVEHVQVHHDLRKGAQRDAKYLALHPQGLVPALDADGAILTQSMAIIEWIDETCPGLALLPADPLDRARVRAMAQVIACDIHPLNNLRVLQSLRIDLDTPEEAVLSWIKRWIDPGFSALERMLGASGNEFAYGAAPGLVECCLVPQVYSARRFGVDLSAFPRIAALDALCADLPAFVAAAPENQPDFC